MTDPDAGTPSAARVYDYFLGGAHHFWADRDFAARVLEQAPQTAELAQANRRFLHRAVRWAVHAGYRQFLDLGSGIPTKGNVHEIALDLAPDARVAYVDSDPVAVAHSAELLANESRATITRADLREAEGVLSAPGVVDLLDLSEPVALLLVAVFHFVPRGDDPAGVVGAYRERLALGSGLVLSHGSADHDDAVVAEQHRTYERLYQDSGNPVTLRDRDELRAISAGFDLVPPGLVDVVDWPVPAKPGTRPSGCYGLVGTSTTHA